jgi:hypothetical protein
MDNIYEFERQRALQVQFVDAFANWMENRTDVNYINRPTHVQDLSGIDLVVKLKDGRSVNFQIKTDFLADKTNNLPYEIISQAYCDRPSKIGWGLDFTDEEKKDKYEYLVYIIAGTGEILIVQIGRLAGWVIYNFKGLKTFSTINKDYVTLGVLIPIMQIRHLAFIKSNLTDTQPGLSLY